jgi:opacity protein-like surface antigen
MKTIFFTALISTAIVGSAVAETSSAFRGVYIGGGLNYTSEKIKSNAGSSISFNGGGAKLFLGYGFIIADGLYLGAELGLGYDQIFRSKKKVGLKNNKTNTSAAARFGYAFNTVLPFVKVGYEGRSKSGSIKRSGLLLGGGVDVALTKNVFVRGEYAHTFGSKSTIVVNTQSVIFRTRADTVLLGAGYRY